MIKLIINADDFGRNKTCTQAILEFMEQGLVSNTTLMVTEPYAYDAMELARRKGVADRVGLHLNLTEGCPLTEGIKQCPLFCGKDGRFNGVFHHSLKTRLFLPRSVRDPLSKEIRAQLEKYIDLGGSEMHLDSHHHSHTDFSVARILFPMAKSMGFKTCRLSRDTCGSFAKTCYKSLFNAFVRLMFKTADVFSDEESVLANHHKLDGRIVEIMAHPIRTSSGCLEETDAGDAGVMMFETKQEALKKFCDKIADKSRMMSYEEYYA